MDCDAQGPHWVGLISRHFGSLQGCYFIPSQRWCRATNVGSQNGLKWSLLTGLFLCFGHAPSWTIIISYSHSQLHLHSRTMLTGGSSL